jgi:hypothetical protein
MCQAGGPFKMDVDKLYISAGCKTKPAFNKILDHLIGDGNVTISDNFLPVKSAQKPIESAVNRSSKAKTSANTRWGNKSNKNKGCNDADAPSEHVTKGMLDGMPDGMPEECYLNLNLNLNLKVEDKSSTTQEKAAAAFQTFLETHPRPVDTRKGLQKFMEILASGVPSETLIQAAANYAESVAGFSEKAKVQQSDNFLDDDRGLWRDHVA